VFSTFSTVPVTDTVTLSTTVIAAFKVVDLAVNGRRLQFEFSRPVVFFNASRVLFLRPSVEGRRRAGADGDRYTLVDAATVAINPARPEEVSVEMSPRDERALATGGYSSFSAQDGLAIALDGTTFVSDGSVQPIRNVAPSGQESNDDELTDGGIAGSK
jgi:hypothetical protein